MGDSHFCHFLQTSNISKSSLSFINDKTTWYTVLIGEKKKLRQIDQYETAPKVPPIPVEKTVRVPSLINSLEQPFIEERHNTTSFDVLLSTPRTSSQGSKIFCWALTVLLSKSIDTSEFPE